MADLGSTAWFLAVVGGTTVLGLAFAYAVSLWGRRDRRLDPVREEATRELYAEEREAEVTGGGSNASMPPPVTRPAPPPAADVTRRSNAA